jgi:hypothetical protein
MESVVLLRCFKIFCPPDLLIFLYKKRHHRKEFQHNFKKFTIFFKNIFMKTVVLVVYKMLAIRTSITQFPI